MIEKYRLWPDGFTGRVTLVLAFAIAVQFVAGSIFIGASESHIQRQDLGRRIAEQLSVAERVVEAAAPRDRARLIEMLSTPHLRLRLLEKLPDPAAGAEAAAADIAKSMLEWEPSLGARGLMVSVDNANDGVFQHSIEGTIRISDGTWIAFQTKELVAGWVLLIGTSIRFGLVAMLVLGSAALLVRTLSAPLRRLSDNSQLIGTSLRIDFEEGEGPQELRLVSQALNGMQDRIEGLIAQRTHALAAVGHDLRTPLARLRLRITALADHDERAAAEYDIDQMSRMLQELLDYFDTGPTERELEPVDLASLCQMIAEKFADLRADVSYFGPDRLIMMGDYDGLRRAVENLVDNAVKYAGAAEIHVSESDSEVAITVSDYGPGIAESDLQRAITPFERLDSARSNNHPGMGLGLSIVQHAVDAHNGRLELAKNRPNGLYASLIMPAK